MCWERIASSRRRMRRMCARCWLRFVVRQGRNPDPIAAFRASGYAERVARERTAIETSQWLSRRISRLFSPVVCCSARSFAYMTSV